MHGPEGARAYVKQCRSAGDCPGVIVITRIRFWPRVGVGSGLDGFIGGRADPLRPSGLRTLRVLLRLPTEHPDS